MRTMFTFPGECYIIMAHKTRPQRQAMAQFCNFVSEYDINTTNGQKFIEFI